MGRMAGTLRRAAAGALVPLALLVLAGALAAAAAAARAWGAARGRGWVARWDPRGPAVQERVWELGRGDWPGAWGVLGGPLGGGASWLREGVQLRASHSAVLPLELSARACLAAPPRPNPAGAGGGGRELRDAEVSQHAAGGAECAGGLREGVVLRVEMQARSRSVETAEGRRGGGAAGGAWIAVRAVPTLGGVPLDVVPFAAAALAAAGCGVALAEAAARWPPPGVARRKGRAL